MSDMSQSHDPSRARSWAWGDRSLTGPDNPVKRWLGHRPWDTRLQVKHRRRILRRLIVRPAMQMMA